MSATLNNSQECTEVKYWRSDQYVGTLRHDQSNLLYNGNFRQLLHVAFKVAAKMGSRYSDLLVANRQVVEKNVTRKLSDRHMKPVFVG